MSSRPEMCSPQEAEEFRRQFSILGPIGNGQLANPDQQDKRDDGEPENWQADAPILAEQQRQDPQHENTVPDYVNGEAGEEIGQRGHVSVDTLDHPTGGVVLVKSGIQVQGMIEQIQPEGIGCRPGHRLSYVGGSHGQALRKDSDAEKQQSRTNQDRPFTAFSGCVNEDT